MYKTIKQSKDNEKLDAYFLRDSTPKFIRKYFVNLRSGKSKLNYYVTIKSFLEKNFNLISEVTTDKVRELDYIDVVEYLDNLIEQGYKPGSVSTKKDELSSFFNYLANTRVIEENIVLKISKSRFSFKTGKMTNKLPSKRDIELFQINLSNIANKFSKIRNIIVMKTFMYSGLREGEIAGLNIDDIFLEGECPYILVLRKGCYHASERNKTYIPASLARKLKLWLCYRERYFDDIKDKEALFLNRNGCRFNEDNIKKMFTRYGGGITPHMLRYYYITELLKETDDQPFVQEQVGHRIGSYVTMDVYAVGRERSREIIRRM